MAHLDLTRLSPQEMAILTHAIGGLTDHQIAKELGIRPATVNSYWVRIRGKLGSLSRTEMVSSLLQQRATVEHAEFLVQIAGLQEELKQAKASLENIENVDHLRSIADGHPEAVLTVHDDGTIGFANQRAEALFGYDEGRMKGLNIDELLRTDVKALVSGMISALLSAEDGFRLVPSFAMAKPLHGELFGVLVKVGTTTDENEKAHVFVIRSFADEVQLHRSRAVAILFDERLSPPSTDDRSKPRQS